MSQEFEAKFELEKQPPKARIEEIKHEDEIDALMDPKKRKVKKLEK